MDVETRFEYPGAATIQTFLRTLPDTVRRQESTRKDARARWQERELAKAGGGSKAEEPENEGNAAMRTDWEDCGRGRHMDDDRALQQLDLDADWDPEVHEKQMAELVWQ
ncbi:hypothetical protein M378DRAFT_641450 [Amanita muscaria Koide BX008]|uniref:Uncharacterized protein n=1 Tax=Amanita muscaria (strain Koide BX008) TaxID=946122 RepID=A0A0C2SLE8_AMAMK|nr:hypothetical protein M378DRAFT_641450 [Amanita muscaria Koide BX008]